MQITVWRICSNCFALLFVAAYCLAGAAAASNFGWPKTLQDIPAANATPISTIEALVNSAGVDEGLPHLRIGEFRFAALEKNRIDLVATIDSSGRQLFYSVIGICQSDTGYRHFTLASAPPHLLAREVIDLGGTGVNQLIAKRLVGQYHGAQTTPAFWHSIYKVEGCVPKDVSPEYPKFYQNEVLPEFAFIERALSQSENPGKNARKEYEAEAAFVELKYQQLILKRPNAGIQQALSWAESPDPDIQMLAVDILRGASTPVAMSVLHRLEAAPNYEVSQAAKAALGTTSKIK
jgi:hypothetical protein